MARGLMSMGDNITEQHSPLPCHGTCRAMSTAAAFECHPGMGRPQAVEHHSTKPIDRSNRDKMALINHPTQLFRNTIARQPPYFAILGGSVGW